jgi:putative transcriptional regulator
VPEGNKAGILGVSEDMDSLRGQLLISNGSLFDPNFRHTVVLVGEHNEDGALGVVLNRPLDVAVAEAAPTLGALVEPEEALYHGGPVQPHSPVLVAEFTRPELADILIFGSVGFLVGEIPEDIRFSLVRGRVFAGYSGWGPGQLESEMEQDSWIVDPARVDDVFTTAPDLLWSRVLKRKGPAYHQMSRIPFDPSMN